MRGFHLTVRCSKRRWFAVFCTFWSLVLGWGDECDIYVANAGAGNCVFVRFSTKGEQRGLWVDCGIGFRGFSPSGYLSDEWNEVIRGFLFETGMPAWGSKEQTMLWITHLHNDHINEVFQINRDAAKRTEAVNVGSIVVGVRSSEDLRSADVAGGLPGKILRNENVTMAKVWGWGRRGFMDGLSAVIDNFWGNFPHESIALKPLIPSEEYGKNGNQEGYKENLDDENDTSLVLGLEYYGVKVLFPGDAPGKMCDCLNPNQKGFVKDVDILIAPHHGSEGKKNSLWYSSNRRFCTIISGDPSYKAWGIPGLANYGVRSHSTRLKAPRAIYYSNAQRNEVLKSETEFPVFCTWIGVEDEDGKVVGAQKFVGYHIKINSDGDREDEGKVKVFEILYDDKAKGNETRYPEEEICIERLSKRRQLELSETSVLFEIPTATGGGGVGY